MLAIKHINPLQDFVFEAIINPYVGRISFTDNLYLVKKECMNASSFAVYSWNNYIRL